MTNKLEFTPFWLYWKLKRQKCVLCTMQWFSIKKEDIRIQHCLYWLNEVKPYSVSTFMVNCAFCTCVYKCSGWKWSNYRQQCCCPCFLTLHPLFQASICYSKSMKKMGWCIIKDVGLRLGVIIEQWCLFTITLKKCDNWAAQGCWMQPNDSEMSLLASGPF